MLHGALGDDETGMLFSAAYLSRSWRPLPGVSSTVRVERAGYRNALELGDELGHAPRRDDLEGGVAGGEGQLEADLVIAASGQRGRQQQRI
jgi:hypothetical protein